jgi:hypothetical protein
MTMHMPRDHELHENVTILETETSTSEYSRRTSDQDDASTTYLAANLFGQSPAAHTHDDGDVHYYDGDYDYAYEEDRTPKDDPLAASVTLHHVALSSTIIHGHMQDRLALWINCATVGVAQALFQSLLYPYLKIYLNMDEYRAHSAELLVALPWSFKLALALLSDCVPIQGMRRKPYLYVGWALCGIFSLVVACIPSETPYLEHGKVANGDAAKAGAKYMGLFFMASLGLVLVSVVCDAIVVEFSHREIESKRGSVLLTAAMARYAGHAAMTLLVAFLCNSKAYGGDFAWGASPNLMGLFVVAASIVAIATTHVYLVEDVRRQRPTQASNPYDPSRASTLGEATPQPFDTSVIRPSELRTTRISVVRARPQTLWAFVQRRTTLQLVVYVFLARACFAYYTASTKVVYETWLSISPLLSNLFTVVNSLVFAGVAFLLRQSHLLASWKRLIQGAVLISVVITVIPFVFFVTNVVRNNVLTLLVEQLVAFVDAVAYFAIILAVLDASEASGLEASSFAFFTSIANAAIPFATSVAQSIGSHFDAYDSEWKADAASARWKMVYALIVWVLFRCANLALLPLLPSQKRELHMLKEFGGSHRVPALYITAAAAFALLWVPFTTILAAVETTACLTVAGGEGC